MNDATRASDHQPEDRSGHVAARIPCPQRDLHLLTGLQRRFDRLRDALGESLLAEERHTVPHLLEPARFSSIVRTTAVIPAIADMEDLLPALRHHLRANQIRTLTTIRVVR